MDEVVELEGELRVAKTSLAVALGEKEEMAHALNLTRKSLMAAIQQLTLVQQVRVEGSQGGGTSACSA